MFMKKSDNHFAMFSRLEVERFLYLIKALGVGIRLDWGRQISAHVFINRTQSSLSFMRLEWRGNSRLAVESSPLRLTFLSQRVGKSWECQGGQCLIFSQCVRWREQKDINCLCLLSLWSAATSRHTGRYLSEINLKSGLVSQRYLPDWYELCFLQRYHHLSVAMNPRIKGLHCCF